MGLQRKTDWDLNPGKAAKPRETITLLWQSGDPVALGCSLLPHGLRSRRDFARKKRGERTLAGGP